MAKIPATLDIVPEHAEQSPVVWLVADTTTTHGAETEAHVSAETHEGAVAHGDDGGHSATFPPFDSSTYPSQLLWLAITFAALYFLMSRVALPRIGEILETRQDNIEGKLAEAERMRQKTDQALQDYETALATAKSKSLDIAEETRTNVKADLDAKRTKVETDLAKKISEAETRIQATKTEALGNVGEIAAETAQNIVAKITGKVAIKAARDAVTKVTKEQA